MSRECFQEVMSVFAGSDGNKTKALYDRLNELGPKGVIATNLLRASKNSTRAKQYRGGIRGQGSYRSMAYERKTWAMDNLAKVLTEHAEACGLTWGWAMDARGGKHAALLYIDLPNGQVSFHTEGRGVGPDYLKPWDGLRGASVGRICGYAGRVLEDALPPAPSRFAEAFKEL